MARLKQRFLETEGDLKEVALALIEAPEAWTTERLKLKRPSEWLISISRSTEVACAEEATERLAQSH